MSNSLKHRTLSRLVARAVRASSRRPKVTIALWFAMIVERPVRLQTEHHPATMAVVSGD